MSFVKNILLEFRTSVSPDVYTFVYCASSASLNLAIETLKVTDTINGKYNAVLPVSVGGSMEVKGLVRIDSALGLPEITTLALSFTKVKVRYSITDAAGNIKRFIAFGFIVNIGVDWTIFSLAENTISISLSGIIEVV